MKGVKKKDPETTDGTLLAQVRVRNHPGSEEQARSRVLAQPLAPRCVHGLPGTGPSLLPVPRQAGAPFGRNALSLAAVKGWSRCSLPSGSRSGMMPS